MKKISSILENYIIGNIPMTYQEFYNYQNLVKSELHKIYSEEITIDKMVFVAKQSFDNPKRIKSIINYANSNMLLCEWIIEKFKCSTLEELFNSIKRESKNLFSPEGSYFNNVLEKLIYTEGIGIKNEEFAAKFVEDFLAQREIETKVFRTETDCHDDLIEGIDLYFDYKGRKITCQVKPLKDVKEVGPNLGILSSGKLKPYKVNYLIFVNSKKNKAIMFHNKDVTYDNKTAIIKAENLVASKN